jgi:hypothetical protein
VKRALAVALLVLALALAGSAAGSSATAAPAARDKAAARAFAAAASAFLKGIDDSQARALTLVQADLTACAATYSSKVDERRMSDLESFLAQARALPELPVLWRAMLARWSSVHSTSRPLQVVLAAARSQRAQVARLGQGAAQPEICTALAAWESGGWSNTYVADLEQAWNDSVTVDQDAIDAARNRVADVGPQLRKLGLTSDQITTLIIATF